MTEQARFAASSLLFSAAVLTSAALIFIFGAFGLPGNSMITGGYLLVTIASAPLLGRQKGDRPVITWMDVVFAVLATAVTIASILHFDGGDYKEYMLLAISVIFGYAAGRLLGDPVLSSIRLRLLQVSAPLVAAACIATAPNLVGEIYSRPFVFGFFHAATVFSVAFGYMVIAYIYSDIEWRSKISLCLFVLIVCATAIFVASTVRFVLIAILVTALFSLACSIYRLLRIWRRIALVLLAMILGVIVGTISRYDFVVRISNQLANTGVFSGLAKPGQNVVKVERPEAGSGSEIANRLPSDPAQIANSGTSPGAATPGQNAAKVERPEAGSGAETASKPPGDPARSDAPAIGSASSINEPPSCNKTFDLNNSVAIRRALLSDALFFLPKAGLFGFGLDSFSKMSCFQGYQIHNSVLQAIVEFGWIAGVALTILISIPLTQFLFGHRGFDLNMQFLLSCITFTTLLSLIYGQISRDLTLFLFLGAFAKASSKSANADDLKANASVPCESAPV